SIHRRRRAALPRRESRRDRSRRFRPSPRSRGSRGSASPGGRATSPASQASAVAVVDVAWVSIDANNGLRPRPTIALLPQPCRRRGKRFVNASRAPAPTAHRLARRARGAGAPPVGGTTFPLRFCFVLGSIPKCAATVRSTKRKACFWRDRESACVLATLGAKIAFLPVSNHIS